MKKVRALRSGFTLIELIIVIAIIAVLAAILIPSILGVSERAKATVCASNMHEAVEMYAVAQAEDDGTVSPLDDMDKAMKSLNAKVLTPGTKYSGLCPSGGIVTLTVDSNGYVTLTCSKHGANTTQSFGEALMKSLSSMSRTTTGGRSQKLTDYLSNGTSVVDSEATGAAGAQKSFTQIVKETLGSKTPDNQSWRLIYNKSADDYLLYVTTTGKIKSSESGKQINVIKYEFKEDGTLISQSSAKATIVMFTKTSPNYPYLKT
jgi:prepilin-type N-terminal cleavage/methylation domain-containing protein